MVGLGFGQTIRLNVASILPAQAAKPSSDVVSPAPSPTSGCAVVLVFCNANGNVLKQARASITAGKAIFSGFGQVRGWRS
jgi:hypothetical protein